MAPTRLRTKPATLREIEQSNPRSLEAPDGRFPPRSAEPQAAWLLAEQIWGNRKDADAWMTTPHFELEGRTPASLLTTKLGEHRVENLLSALENGFPV
jgi:putative toxin-antitoxin system antitoxin component (TIGR02293 family)